MTLTPTRCLVLACGNTLREDDGIGPFLAQWAEERFAAEPGVRIVSSHQWTPELSEEIAAADSVLFVDCSINAAPGSVTLRDVEAAAEIPRMMTHHLDAAGLLILASEYFGKQPRTAQLLTIGAASLELREGFSPAVEAAMREAQRTLAEAVRRLIAAE
ncbi:MAG TPA: hydrogenase maturation protease [Terracidiphilus sp.]